MKVATTAIIRDNDKILIGKRRKDGRWELPGGQFEQGETPLQCLEREMAEELGIKVEVAAPYRKITGTYRDIPMEVYAFLADYRGGDISMNVHDDLLWVRPGDISKYDFIDEDIVALKLFGIIS